MLGSQEPAAWAAFADDTGDTGVTSLNRASVEEVANRMGWSVAPLYLSPTLTDLQRAAIEYGVLLCDATAGMANDRATIDGASRAADVLRGLLKRQG
jgi:hypothetical protein